MTENFKNYLENEIEVLQAQSGASVAPPVPMTTVELPNTVVGTGNLEALVPAADSDYNVVFACAKTGDDYPTFVITSDGEIFLGDGTGDPTQAANLYLSTPDLVIKASADGVVQLGSDLTFGGEKGIILRAPDQSLHRLKVADNGTLSTEPMV